MAAIFSKVVLSGSTNGLPIPVAATATAGTLIHTAIAGTTSVDEIWLWVSNVTATPATLTIEWGGVTDPGNHLVKGYVVPNNSEPILIAAGFLLRNTLVVRAFGGTASALNIDGFVNRITGA